MRTSKIVTALMLASITAAAGCAQQAAQIAPTYVSPLQFADYSCEQINSEAQRVASQATAAIGAQNQQASNDQAAMAVGLIIFWPAIFMTAGSSAAQETEIGQLKGQMQALEQASIQGNCGIQFQTAAMSS